MSWADPAGANLRRHYPISGYSRFRSHGEYRTPDSSKQRDLSEVAEKHSCVQLHNSFSCSFLTALIRIEACQRCRRRKQKVSFYDPIEESSGID